MKNFIIAFLVFLVWSFFGLWLYSVLQPENKLLRSDTEVAISDADGEDSTTKLDEPSKTDNDLTIKSDSVSITEGYKDEFISAPVTGLKAISETGDIIFLYPEGFIITKNSYQVVVPPKLVDFKYKLNTYLVEHPETELHIISQYSPSENIESPNLGIKRGRELKRILVAAGIPPERIVIKPHITQIAFSEDNTFLHSFSFVFKAVNTKRINALKNQIPESRTVYPNFSSQGILINEELNKLKTEVSEIIKENPNLQIEIIGHTDNVGNAIDNYRTGLVYARQLRWFLVSTSGIDRNRITAISKGESENIAGNDTERERNLNRRLEVKFYMDTYE